MKLTLRYIILFLILIFHLHCPKKAPKKKLITFYKNINAPILTKEETGITYEYIAKIRNHFERPIIVPYTQYGQLPIVQTFTSDIKKDSLVNINSYSGSNYLNFGVDTLFSNDNQKYFVLLSFLDKPRNKNSYYFITFKYYFFDDFSKNPWGVNNSQYESFILYRDSLNVIHIYNSDEGFNPFVNKSHPIPD